MAGFDGSEPSAAAPGAGSARQRAGSLAGMDAVELSSGWGVLHLFYNVDREHAEADRGAQAGRGCGAVARGRRPPGAGVRGARPQGRPRGDGARSRPRPAAGVPAGAVGRAARARRLVRVADRGRSTRRPKTTSGRGSSRGRRRPATHSRRRSRPGASGWRTTASSGCTRAAAQADDLLLPDVEAARRGRELVRAALRGAQAS